MQHAFDRLSEATEWLLSRWWGAGGYFALWLLAYAGWLWDGLDRFVYVTGGAILVLLVGTSRRDSKAAQAKLDTLTPGHTLDRIEERDERAIEAARQAVPGVYSEEQGR